ncbi:MAG TPA: DUF2855 domain-containing protein [Hydrogenophaga sp.]|uniref:DUF2855 family protein n=1 Tax=Hydrogenophaga sp. TaxID=1904254 RepID=UPI0008B59FC9|nr:DUF2855 family protein [Hydrogenophaga sp.]OGA74255.1 MAG: hypothetical protein A2X73_16195 [Burkholderiales bacterium GWE1_65_30]OGA89610.1 MAG: hypothetical protein A2X72_09480 [Burkholderiales bacterium GWF1_66_17]HAX22752.1 DUF2855 domain-containing protein [Hydrogenophaga sp.]HBU18291.1 DUF2855 domain-containing protein [Hydrogenophaga sp.]
MTTTQFQVRKDQLDTTRTVQLPEAPLSDGQVRVRIEQFAYTSNNITYAAFGEAMDYWRFFPVLPQADDAPWGIIPVWGFGVVVETTCAGVAEGERLYGYWPMASDAVLQPVRVSPEGFFDGAPHRAALHPVYNHYLRCAVDPLHDPASEPLQALLRPLFLTAGLIDDFLADNAFFGTSQPGRRGAMLLSSASSKTAYATAAQLAHRPEVQVIGLTSVANVAFCQSLGVYSRVLTYDQLDALPIDTPCVYVDFAGNGALRKAIHSRFTALAYSCSIGGTHVDQLAGARDLPGPRPVLFFAPAQAKKRHADWGAAGFNERMARAWHAFTRQVSQPPAPWLVVQHHSGPEAVQAAHALVLGGRGDPRLGHMLSLSGGV